MKLFIPWRVFFRSFIKQSVNSRDIWLTFFKFDDRGVELIPEIPISPAEILEKALLASPEKQEPAIVSALAERKRIKLCH